MLRPSHATPNLIILVARLGLLLLGHAYMVLLVMLCQTLVYREVTALFSLKSAKPESYDEEHKKGKDPWKKTLNWYFFAVTNYFLYGESIIYYFKVQPFAHLLPTLSNRSCGFSACSVCRRPVTSICDKPSYHQLHTLYNRLHGIRDVAEEGLSETTVWLVLLGAHESITHCSLKVRSLPVFNTITIVTSFLYAATSSSTIFWKDSFGSGSPRLS